MIRLIAVFTAVAVVVSIPMAVLGQEFYGMEYGLPMPYGLPYGGVPYGQDYGQAYGQYMPGYGQNPWFQGYEDYIGAMGGRGYAAPNPYHRQPAAPEPYYQQPMGPGMYYQQPSRPNYYQGQGYSYPQPESGIPQQGYAYPPQAYGYPQQGYSSQPMRTPDSGYRAGNRPERSQSYSGPADQGIYWDTREYGDPEYQVGLPERQPVQPRLVPRGTSAVARPAVRTSKQSARSTVGKEAARRTVSNPAPSAVVRPETVQSRPTGAAPERTESLDGLRWGRSSKPAMVDAEPGGVASQRPKETTSPPEIKAESGSASSDLKWGRER